MAGRSKTRPVDARSLLFAVVVVIPVVPGCVSFSLPGPLNRFERELVESTHFHASVGVAPYQYPAWSDSLVDVLRATGLFDVVGRLGEIDEPDLLIHVRETPTHANPLPFLPAITLGVIPIIDEDEQGEIFSIQSRQGPFLPATGLSNPQRPPAAPSAGKDVVQIEFRYKGQVHIGWIALLTGLSPSRSWLDPSWTRRYRDNLSRHICRKKDEIQAMISRSRGAAGKN